MEKIDWFKYSAFILAFIVLFIPEGNKIWIYFLIIAGLSLLVWAFKSFEDFDLFKYATILFGILMLISEMGSKEQKWFIWLTAISFTIWTLKKWVFKSE